jgi:hypothetical protein
MPQLAWWLYATDIALGLAHVVGVWAGSPGSKLRTFLNLDAEANLPTWYSSSQLLAIGVLFALAAYWRTDTARRGRVLIGLLAAVFVLLSLDETATIHEWLGQKSDALLLGGHRNGTAFWRTGIWMFVVGLPFVALFLSLLHAVREYLKPVPGVFGRLLGGALLLFGAALIPETIVNFIPKQSSARMIEVVIEEVGEMMGATTILWAAYTLVLATWATHNKRLTSH